MPSIDSTIAVNDAHPGLAQRTTDAERLSLHANSLGAKPDRATASTAGAVLPDTHIAGAETAKITKPGWFSRQLTGIGAVAGAIGSGVAGKFENGFHTAEGGVLAAGNAVGSLYEHPGEIVAAGRRAVAAVTKEATEGASATGALASRVIADPSGTLADVGHRLAAPASGAADAAGTAGTAAGTVTRETAGTAVATTADTAAGTTADIVAPTTAGTTRGSSVAAGAAAADDALDPEKVSTVVRSADIFDNYSPEMGADGQAIKGPFKIAALRGPAASRLI
jgi:hypothetical protein